MTITQSAWCATTPKRLQAVRAESTSGLKSVASALDVLECFAVDGDLGVTDIARKLGMAKSTAHRLLQTLVSRGFVEQDRETGTYRLGLHLYELGHLAQMRNELRYAALPTLQQVAAATGLTVNLAIPDGADVVFVERLENTDGVRILGHLGRRLPAHTTSSGKVIAAFNSDLYERRVTAGFPPRLSATVRSLQDWDEAVETARTNGYAASKDESFTGASSVAVPVLHRRVAVGAVSVFGPSELIDPRIAQLAPLLTTAANRIVKAVTA